MIVDPGIGGERQVGQQQAAEVARADPQIPVEAVGGGLLAGVAVGGEAQVGVEVDLAAVLLSTLPDPGRHQLLELRTQLVGGTAQRRW